MAVTATIAQTCTVVETLGDSSLGSSANSVTHNAFNESHALTAATTPPVTKVAAGVAALSAGAKTLDLTAIAGTNGVTVDGDTLKVQAFQVKNLGGNAMTFTEGASNGYELAGNGWKMILATGQHFQFYGNDATPDVSSTTKTIDVSGSGSQTFEYIVVFG